MSLAELDVVLHFVIGAKHKHEVVDTSVSHSRDEQTANRKAKHSQVHD